MKDIIANESIKQAQVASWRDYATLCKPKVVLLLLITAWVGMQLASTQSVSVGLMFTAMLGIGLAACSAAVINHLVDAHIDVKMNRTKNRPIVTGQINNRQAIIFSLLMAVTSMALLIIYVNPLTALLTSSGLIGYAFVYTVYLKHRTSQNIVFGGIAGALPPVLGWTSITNSVDVEPLLLMLIIFVWTPPHFWALAIDRVEDYKNAKIPMLPVVHGIPYTKTCIVSYTLALNVVSVLPFFYGMSGWVYLVSALVLGGWFLYYALELKYFPKSHSAMKTFKVSVFYLLLLFIAFLSDHYLKGLF
ncbi:MAG: protoheme IX farnesyltransferase [Alteromonadaceae bacterium]|nr:protoheme IX farnesyltransferase [Alteromonadaceae bacterium]